MQMTRMKRSLSLLLCMVLIAAMALFTTGCGDNTEDLSSSGSDTSIVFVDGDVLGEGEKQFTFVVADQEGTESTFTIHTDQTTVGAALLDLGMLAGEDGPYGLYVKTVNGITADYDMDGVYWAFYIDGEYAVSGVDTTEIVEGSTYTFKVEKA